MSMVAVCSGKGSPGATFVAVNLAAALARAGAEPLLLDLDPAGGDVAAYLGLGAQRGLYPLLRMNESVLQPEALLHEAEDKDGVLCVGGLLERSSFDSSSLVGVADAAIASGKLVIADFGRVNADAADLVKRADLVLLAVRPDLVSVLGAERAMKLLRAWCAPDRLRAVVSCLERKRPGDVKEVSDALRVPVLGSIPRDHRAARRALIAQHSCEKGSLPRAFATLARSVTEFLGPARETQLEPEAVTA